MISTKNSVIINIEVVKIRMIPKRVYVTPFIIDCEMGKCSNQFLSTYISVTCCHFGYFLK